MPKLIIVSNRLPMSVTKEDGELQFSESIGGLATGLQSFFDQNESLWIGWPGLTNDEIDDEERSIIDDRLAQSDYRSFYLDQSEMEDFYYGFCNKTVWPLFHYFHLYAQYEDDYWNAYRRINERVAKVVGEVVEPGDTVWVQDYHFLLLPAMLRRAHADIAIGHFLHIPFPSYEIFRLLPWRRELLEGLLGADLVGFHTFDYARHFLSAVRRILGHDHQLGVLQVGERRVRADAFPMGIDYERFADAGELETVQEEIATFRSEVQDRKIIFSVDRLDYTKGIPERLIAFDHFLDKYPQYQGEVSMILVAAPSRTGVDQYRQLKKQVDEMIGDINGRHAQVGYVPIWYLYQSQSFAPLRALYEVADVALITPLRDGMNLVAKEFVASKVDGRGVLVLSEMAGAAGEMVEALQVNPNAPEQIADALHQALSMPEAEQERRLRRMQGRLERYTVERWAHDFLEILEQTQNELKGPSVNPLRQGDRENIQTRIEEAEKRLFLLDYDGTLVGFSDRPEDARPDGELKRLLAELSEDPRNQVLIISGRDRETLNQWLGDLDVDMVAEHGVWIREGKSEWQTIEPLDASWKEAIRPLMERTVDRTPGSFIEEKSFALAWHYRQVNASLASVRAPELKEMLLQLTANMELNVLDGEKVLEVKNVGVNKGRAALHWLEKDDWDFVLALGDDWTDEDTFAALPSDAYTIKVRYNPTVARWNIRDVEQVRALLSQLNASHLPV